MLTTETRTHRPATIKNDRACAAPAMQCATANSIKDNPARTVNADSARAPCRNGADSSSTQSTPNSGTKIVCSSIGNVRMRGSER